MTGSGAPSRRHILQIGVAFVASLVAGACTGGERPQGGLQPSTGTGEPLPSVEPSVESDDRLRAGAADQERHLLDLHAATLRRHPSLANRLRPLTEHHAAHLSALEVSARRRPRRRARVATRPDAALHDVAAAERHAAQAAVAACARTGSADLARLLASVAGCEAAHGVLLDEVR